MKKINATRDEIVKMLESGEIVFAADSEDHFLVGQGIILYGNKPAYSFRHWERELELPRYYGRKITVWYVDCAKPFEFQVGDICEFGGVEGVISEVRDVPEYKYPVFWKSICENHGNFFTLDGRLATWHSKPLLNFIRRPKKKKTIEIVTWVVASESGALVGVYDKAPDFGMHPNWKLLKSIATTEIEVEEE